MDEESASLSLGLGQAKAPTVERQQLPEVYANLLRAFDYYIYTVDVGRAVAVAEYPFLLFTGVSGQMAQFITKALAPVPPDSFECAGLLARYGAYRGRLVGDYKGAQEAFGRTLSIALNEGDETLEIRVGGSSSWCGLRTSPQFRISG